jgi:hypothetical protein
VRVRSPGSEAGPSKRSRSKQDSRRHRRTDRTDSEDSDRPRRDKRKRKPKARPRRSSIDGADTEDEDATAAIELDEPDRFKSDTRLRTHRKTNFQSKLRQLSKRRVAQGLSQDVHGSSSEDSESDSSSPSASSDSRNFIASDDDIPNRRATVPEEFSLKRETPEQKFKVVFHYLVVLIIRGARNFLPLQGEDNVYFGRQLYNVRKTMRGLRDSMAGALWRPDFRDAIETYPLWKVRLDIAPR